jgi:glutathione peroxidase-family protein
MSKKVYVNGEKAHPLFVDLVAESNFNEVPWNFTKFIVHNNEVIGIAPDETRDQIEIHLKKMLGI